MINEPIRLPKIEVIAPNVCKVYLPTLTLMYSYETVVGFKGGNGKVVFTSERYTNTTSKHLTTIFGSEKKERLDPEVFAELLEKELDRVFKQN
jgi:hypothetical protein